MPSLPRSQVFDETKVGIYHCFSVCVRNASLCGFDQLLQKDCSHRKDWILEGLKSLAGAMAIDVLDYAVLDTHLHVVLRNRPDIVARWSDEEVAWRWWMVCPKRKKKDGSPAEPKDKELRRLQSDPDMLKEYRLRLSSISWFMRQLTQPIAKRANLEDDVKGRFFRERFGSEPIESLAQLLTCSMYVDLNLIRAEMALTPEDSQFTSAYDRIRARLCRQRQEFAPDSPEGERGGDADADAWLAPIFLDERASAYENPEQAAAANSIFSDGDAKPTARASNKGFLPITLDEYLELLDWTGRQLRSDKRGAIPAGLAPILERLQLDADLWIDSLAHYEPRTRRNSAFARPSSRRRARKESPENASGFDSEQAPGQQEGMRPESASNEESRSEKRKE